VQCSKVNVPLVLYDLGARRRTVSETINEDLARKATAAGINISRTAKAAVAEALRTIEVDRIRAELQEAAALIDAYVAKYGYPFEDWANPSD
jgi:post-segregation antitoxin (ccd killing protein)